MGSSHRPGTAVGASGAGAEPNPAAAAWAPKCGSVGDGVLGRALGQRGKNTRVGGRWHLT